jgi:hypothetical protein
MIHTHPDFLVDHPAEDDFTNCMIGAVQPADDFDDGITGLWLGCIVGAFSVVIVVGCVAAAWCLL